MDIEVLNSYTLFLSRSGSLFSLNHVPVDYTPYIIIYIGALCTSCIPGPLTNEMQLILTLEIMNFICDFLCSYHSW